MEKRCEFIDMCPMFKYFRSNAKRVYLEVYCEGYFDTCKRRELRLEGETVPENLLPHGGTLWDDKRPENRPF